MEHLRQSADFGPALVQSLADQGDGILTIPFIDRNCAGTLPVASITILTHDPPDVVQQPLD